jgi:hypothetical protein
MGKGTLLVEGIVNMEIEGYNLFWYFLVVPAFSGELIIGAIYF